MSRHWIAVGLLLANTAACAQDAAIDELLAQATQAAQRGEYKVAIDRLSAAIKAQPAEPLPWYLRGREQFRAGHINESVADFDQYVRLLPSAENQQWERGISCYYAGEYAKGAKQFEDYQKFHDQDVENSAWRYLCVARTSGVEKAQANMLPIAADPRVPMMEIYDLYRGKLKPAEVLAAAESDKPDASRLNQRLFYAHLYIGLWHEAAGRNAEAKTHILEAEKHKIAHYMWDVAHVHAERLRAREQVSSMTRPEPQPIDPAELRQLALGVIAADRFPMLATIDGDQPRVRPVSPVRSDGFSIYVANLRLYHKTGEIAANPKVELCYLDDGHNQVRLTGVAEIVTDQPLLAEIWNTNPLLRQYLGSIDNPQLIVYCIRPKQVRYMQEWALEYRAVAFAD